jgi:hypothetical protein
MSDIYERMFGSVTGDDNARVYAAALRPELFAWQIGGLDNATLAVNINPIFPLAPDEMDSLFRVLARTQMVTDGTKAGTDILQVTESMQNTLGRQRFATAYPTVTDLDSYLVFIDNIVAANIDSGRYQADTNFCTDGASFKANAEAFAAGMIAAINEAGGRP